MAKQYAESTGPVYFNQRPLKSSPDDQVAVIHASAQKVLQPLNYPVWCTVDWIQDRIRKTWLDSDQQFLRWWLDRLVAEYGLMIWNATWRSNSGSKKADQLADQAQEKFLKSFL